MRLFTRVGEKNTPRSVYRYARRESDFCSQCWPVIAAKPAYSVSSDRVDQPGGGVNPSYPVIDRIRYVDVPIEIQRHCLGMIQHRLRGRSAIAAETVLARRAKVSFDNRTRIDCDAFGVPHTGYG